MSDDMDRAQEREEEIRSDALAERERRAHAHDALVSAEVCSVCEELIPAQRRAALPGVQTCIECQCDVEKRGAA